ncbi:MAG: ATP-binding protein, partial [Bdellovibrionales bacterium]|nr:ATP-binding protein [Bdellovibrionales bacterium]
MEFQRILNLPNLLKKKSFFLFGPRASGKSYLINKQLPKAKVYDLLHAPTFARLSRAPTLLQEESKENELIVIDEIQKLPKLLDEVHRLIENSSRTFLLTGSSGLKLRKGGANLLAGRAWEAQLFPLVSKEIDHFDLNRYLLVGGLPSIYPSEEPFEELFAYTSTYLKEEIQAQAAVRKFEPFVSFFDLIASKVSEEVNFQSLAEDCGVSPKSIRNYLQLLDDTLVAFLLPPYKKTKQRKATSRAKFYFADIGIGNSLSNITSLSDATEHYGECFEQFIILELRAYLSYTRRREQLFFWRSQSGLEVDIVLGDKLAIEVKSTKHVQTKHLKGLKAFREEGLVKDYIIVSRDPEERLVDGIRVLPWQV